MDSPQIALEVAAALDEQQLIQRFKIDEASLATLPRLSLATSMVGQSNLNHIQSSGGNLLKV